MPGVGVMKPAPIPIEARIMAYDKELRIKSSLESIYTDFSGLYNTEKKSLPNAIYMQINEGNLSDSCEATISMKYPLRLDGVYGDDFAIGTEEQPETKQCKIFRDNLRKAVSAPGYGVEKLDPEYLNLFEKHIDDLADWNKEKEDLEIHQALLETYGDTLWKRVVPKCWNPNIFIAGHHAYSNTHPAYDANSAKHTENIVAALNAPRAVGGVPTPGPSILDVTALNNLSNFALKKRIEPLNIPGLPGNKGYVLTVSELQAGYMSDPAWTAKNLGSLWLQKVSLPEKVQGWTGVMGAYKNMLIVVDMRAPTVRHSNGGLLAGYVRPGDIDERCRGDEGVFDVAVLHGKAALWKWYPEKLHRIRQPEDYERIQGTGTACVRGIGIPIYRKGTFDPIPGMPTTPEIEQFSSVVALCGMPMTDPGV